MKSIYRRCRTCEIVFGRYVAGEGSAREIVTEVADCGRGMCADCLERGHVPMITVASITAEGEKKCSSDDCETPVWGSRKRCVRCAEKARKVYDQSRRLKQGVA